MFNILHVACNEIRKTSVYSSVVQHCTDSNNCTFFLQFVTKFSVQAVELSFAVFTSGERGTLSPKKRSLTGRVHHSLDQRWRFAMQRHCSPSQMMPDLCSKYHAISDIAKEVDPVSVEVQLIMVYNRALVPVANPIKYGGNSFSNDVRTQPWRPEFAASPNFGGRISLVL